MLDRDQLTKHYTELFKESMNVFNVIGLIMIVALFAGIFILTSVFIGFNIAAISFAITFGITGFVVLAVLLLNHE